jgi:hypothetical protein
MPELMAIIQPRARAHSNPLDFATDRKEEIYLNGDKCDITRSKIDKGELCRPRRPGTAGWLDHNFISDDVTASFILAASKGYSLVECP